MSEGVHACKDVPIGAEEGGEREFLFRTELGPDQGSLVGLFVPKDDGFRLAVRVQLGPGRRVVDRDLELFFWEVLCLLSD